MVSQPTFGRIYTYFNTKWLFVISLLIFETGSIICATAPTSLALIIGRAAAGAGFAGLYSGTLLVIVDSMPLRQRPLYIGVVTSMFAVSGVAGPLLGGVFTDSKRLTWRFCFWINLRRLSVDSP
jgi:MFS family permease